MKKRYRTVPYLLAALILLCAGFLAALYLPQFRIVAAADGNRIHYGGAVYEETFETPEAEPGRCLGRVAFPAHHSTGKLYALMGEPAYLLVDMGPDSRIYRMVESRESQPGS